jgi:hypothetical protein
MNEFEILNNILVLDMTHPFLTRTPHSKGSSVMSWEVNGLLFLKVQAVKFPGTPCLA